MILDTHFLKTCLSEKLTHYERAHCPFLCFYEKNDYKADGDHILNSERINFFKS